MQRIAHDEEKVGLKSTGVMVEIQAAALSAEEFMHENLGRRHVIILLGKYRAKPTDLSGTNEEHSLSQVGQRLAQLLHRGKDPVADRILEVVPKLLQWVQLGTVGRQRDDAHLGGQPRVILRKMKACPVLDDHMDGRRIMGHDLLDNIPDNFGSYAGDGLGDDWQVQYFGQNNPNAGPLRDPNGDGQTNAFEDTAGLVPNDPNSRFTFTIAPRARHARGEGAAF